MGRTLLGLLLAALLLNSGGQPARAVPGDDDDRADRLGMLINRARLENGALPLVRSHELDDAATWHSLDMVDQQYLDHTGSDGSLPQDRAERAGYHVPAHSGWIVVEVISAISDVPGGPLDWWLNQSPEVHGKALLDPRWREVGIGFAAGGEYGHYWTVLLGCRPDVLPRVALDGQSFQHSELCGPPGVVSLSLTSTTITAGRTLEVRWFGIDSADPRDWLGLYRPSDPDGAYLAWSYVSCGALPLTPRSSGWCWFRTPLDLPAGAYELRLFGVEANARLATSEPVTVLGTP